MAKKSYSFSSGTLLVHTRQFLLALSNGLSNPFMNVYAVMLGATPSEMSIFRAVSNISGVTQIVFGFLSDKLRNRILIIFISGVISSILWIPISFCNTPTQLIVLLSLQAFVNAMSAPAWASLIGDMMPQEQRGHITAVINTSAAIGSILATLVSGFFINLNSLNGTFIELKVVLMISALLGIVASIVTLKIESKGKELYNKISITEALVDMKKQRDFLLFTTLTFFFSYFQSIPWPLFAITQVKVLNITMLQVAYMTVINSAFALIFRPIVGKLVDKVGRKTLIVVGRSGIFIVPLTYIVATDIKQLYIMNAFLGVMAVFSEIAVFAYLLDITPKNLRSSYMAVYNASLAVSTFLGSISGGLFADFISQSFLRGNLVESINIMYFVSMVGRLLFGLSFISIKERYDKKTTFSKELNEFLSYVERKASEIELEEKSEYEEIF
ncbi:MAG: MFS transporter [Thermoproteota archaeon]|nr:MFS transporter [Candidatus Brockarchaeota archaeon]